MADKPSLTLRGLSKPFRDRVWSFDKAFWVGRDVPADLVLAEDNSVNHSQASLSHDESGWRVADLGSTSGTYLNGARIGREASGPLRRGDLLRFGEVALLVDSVGRVVGGRPSVKEEWLHRTTLLLWRLADGDAGDARDELLQHVVGPLHRRTARVLRRYSNLRTNVKPNDVLQNVLLRLTRVLEAAPPLSGQQFFNLAARLIQREVLDLVLRAQGRSGPRAAELTGRGRPGRDENPLTGSRPRREELSFLKAWEEFYRRAAHLPAAERHVFRCLFYEGRTQEETAYLLGVSLPTIRRLWVRARLLLADPPRQSPRDTTPTPQEDHWLNRDPAEVWDFSPDPLLLRQLLGGRVTNGRKLRLFAAACSRRAWNDLDRVGRRCVEAAEYVADSGPQEGTRVREEVLAGLKEPEGVNVVGRLALDPDPVGSAWQVAFLLARVSGEGESAERQAQADLLRDLFGNPFRPVKCDPVWRECGGGVVRSLAEPIYAERAFDRMPILADALEEVGCVNVVILAHCRSGVDHARGCWVVDGLLGKR
jgi:RNA polymerase sigma factor (sigma-70 family)